MLVPALSGSLGWNTATSRSSCTSTSAAGGVAASQRTAAVAAALGGVMLVCLAVVLARHAEQASPLLGGLISPRWVRN